MSVIYIPLVSWEESDSLKTGRFLKQRESNISCKFSESARHDHSKYFSQVKHWYVNSLQAAIQTLLYDFQNSSSYLVTIIFTSRHIDKTASDQRPMSYRFTFQHLFSQPRIRHPLQVFFNRRLHFFSLLFRPANLFLYLHSSYCQV